MSDSFASADGNNRLIGYSYDASGNLLNDQLGHTFSYDGENRPYSAGGVTYYYDGEGERVAKSNGKLYLFGTGSAPVVETDTSGNMTAEYIFFNGKRAAMRKADNSVHYYFADQIGSANVVTNATGAMPPEQDIEYHPYGEQQVYTDTLGQQYKFTGKEHDPETNNDYFGARYYSSTFGRFLTPDWAATPVAIPYAVMGNPQTLNLYSYVQNNPITGTDPDGHGDSNLEPATLDLNAPHPLADDYLLGSIKGAWNNFVAGPANAVNTFLNFYAYTLTGNTIVSEVPEAHYDNTTQAVVGTIVPIALTAGGALAETGAAAETSATSTIEQNAAKGAAFEKEVVAATKATDTNVAEQVTLKTESGVKTRMDVVSTKSSGQVRLQEAKSSPKAPLTRQQKAAHPQIAKSGATVVGKGKPNYPPGTKIPPTEVEITRPTK